MQVKQQCHHKVSVFHSSLLSELKDPTPSRDRPFRTLSPFLSGHQYAVCIQAPSQSFNGAISSRPRLLSSLFPFPPCPAVGQVREAMGGSRGGKSESRKIGKKHGMHKNSRLSLPGAMLYACTCHGPLEHPSKNDDNQKQNAKQKSMLKTPMSGARSPALQASREPLCCLGSPLKTPCG